MDKGKLLKYIHERLIYLIKPPMIDECFEESALEGNIAELGKLRKHIEENRFD